MRKVAIQGIRGSFHDMAIRQYFQGEEVEIVCMDTFEGVFDEMKKDGSLLGLVAIENTIAGSLLHNYDLLRSSGFTIVGEEKLHIEHSIMCLPGESWADLKEVNSHPVALMQCRDFLSRHPDLKLVETVDTAGAARDICERNLTAHAAICSRHVAEIYGLKVLEESIEDNKHNFTRFLLLSDPWGADNLRDVRQCNKSSLVFALPHEEGSLSGVLSIFTFYRINLTKIQSLPIVGKEWQYLFYVDVTYNDYTRFHQCVDAVLPLTENLKILGEYVAKS